MDSGEQCPWLSWRLSLLLRAASSICLQQLLGHQLWKALVQRALLGHIQSPQCLLLQPSFYFICWEASQGGTRGVCLTVRREAQTKAIGKRNGELFSGWVRTSQWFCVLLKSPNSLESVLWQQTACFGEAWRLSFWLLQQNKYTQGISHSMGWVTNK